MLGIGVDAEVTLPIARNPVVLKPADVADFPDRRIELGGVGHGQRFAERGDVGVEQGERARATVLQRGGQIGATALACANGGVKIPGKGIGHG